MTTFSKKHSQIAKGVAILMMLYHHLFVVPERISVEHFSLLDAMFPNAQITIATFCKLCVCIYMFLTGIGLFQQYRGKCLLDMYRLVLIRAVRFMFLFIVIYLLFVPVGYFTGHFVWNWKTFLRGMIGLGLTSFNNTWWFVDAYLFFLAISPLCVYCFGKKHWLKRLLAGSVILIFYVLKQQCVAVFGPNSTIGGFLETVVTYPLFFAMVTGIFCARYNIYGRILCVFDKIQSKAKRKICLVIFSLLFLVISIMFRVHTVRDIVDMRFDFLIAPIFVFSVSTLICELKVERFFAFFGNHSTNMWLTHAFLCYTYCQPLVFLPYYSELVFVWFVILSMIVSYGVNLVLVPLNNKLFSPFHRWSYQGFRCWPAKTRMTK